MAQLTPAQQRLRDKHNPTPTPASQAHNSGGISQLSDIGRGIRRAPVTTFTGIPDLIQMAIEGATGITLPPGLPGTTQQAERLGIIPPPPQTFLGKGSEAALGSILTAPLGMVGGIPKTIRGLATTMGIRPAVEGFAGAGGAHLAETSDVPFLQALSPLFAISAALMGGSAVDMGGRAAGQLSKATPAGRRTQFGAEARELAGKAITEGDTTATRQAVSRAQGFNQDLGTQIGLSEAVPSLQSLSRGVRRDSAFADDLEKRRFAENQEALVGKFNELGPSGVGDFSDTIEAAKRTQAQGEAVRRESLDIAESGLGRSLPDVQDATELGSTLQQQLKAAEQGERARIDGLFKPVNARFAEMPVNTSMIKDTAQQIGKKRTLAEIAILAKNPKYQEITSILEAYPGTITIRELRGFQSVVMQAIRQERGALVPDEKLLGALRDIDRGADAALNQTTRLVSDPALRAQFTQAKNEWRQFRDNFSRGTIGKVLREGGAGANFRTGGVDVASEFLGNDKKFTEKFADLSRAIGREEATKTVQEMAMNDLSINVRDATDSAAVNQQQINTWANQHKTLLRTIPEIRETVSNLRRQGDVVKTLRQGLTKTLDTFDNKIAKAVMTEDPDKIAKAFLKSGNPAAGIAHVRQVVGQDEAAFRGFSKSVWKAISEEGGVVQNTPVSQPRLGSQAMSKMLTKHENALVALYDQESYDRLVRIQQASEIAERGSPQTLFTIDIPKSTFGKNVNTIASRAFGIARRVIGVPFVTAERIGKIVAKTMGQLRQDEIEAVLNNTLHSPELLKIFDSIIDERTARLAANSMKSWAKRNIGVLAPTTQAAARRQGEPQPEQPNIPPS